LSNRKGDIIKTGVERERVKKMRAGKKKKVPGFTPRETKKKKNKEKCRLTRKKERGEEKKK
jgi:hypothetical protein